MTLLQLRYLIEIAECGSINKAAKNLFVSQSGISNALRELEEELGIAIFRRNNKGVEFTEEGLQFYEQIKPMMEMEKSILKRYAGKSGAAALRLRVSAQHYPFAVQAFVRFLQGIDRQKYDLQLRETNTYAIIDEVAGGESDLGILFLSNTIRAFIIKQLTARDLEFHFLKSVIPHAFMRRNHPLAGQAFISVDALEGYPYAVFDKERAISMNFSEEVVLNGFIPSAKSISLNDRCTMYSVLAHSDAYSLGSGLLPAGFSDPNIVAVPIKEPVDQVELGWIQQKGHPLSRAALAYLDILKDCLEETTPSAD